MIDPRCNWNVTDYRCSSRSVTVVVYGCLEGHIGDTVYCKTHLADWRRKFNSSYLVCGICGNRIDSYITKTGYVTSIIA